MGNFCSEYYIKDVLKLVNKNIDSTLLFQHINDAEIFNLVEITGQYFYDYLLGAFTANTLTADEIDIVAIIKNAVAYRAASEAAFFFAVQNTNKGPQIQNSDNSSAAPENLSYKLSAKLRQRAEAFDVRLLNYLADYGDLHANYTSSLNKPLRNPDCGTNSSTSDIFFI